MHVDRRFLNWGVFLLVVGAIPLAVRSGVLPTGVRWFELWPLVLIGWGLGLLLGRTPLAALGGVIVAASIGAVVGGVLAGTGGIGCGGGTATPFAPQSGSFSGATASVTLDPGCGDVDVTTGGSTWQVAGSTANGATPSIDASANRLSVRAPGGFDAFGGSTSWQVRLPQDQPMDLSVTANAGRATLALGQAQIGSLSITVNAGSTRADLSDATVRNVSTTTNAGSIRLSLPATSMTGSFTANLGSIDLCVPPGTAIRIRSGGFLGGNDFDAQGLVHADGAWSTPGYAAASNRIDVSATANLGSISLNPDGGCE